MGGITVTIDGTCEECEGVRFLIQAFLSNENSVITSSHFCPTCDIQKPPREYILDASVPKEIEL